MNYREAKEDLFHLGSDYVLAHCISSDFVMGAGIAVAFTKMGVKDELLQNHEQRWEGKGYCIHTETGNTYNLITKEKVFHKPTYQSLRGALEDMERQIPDGTKIAMPLIGCGLDGLEWKKVSAIVEHVFRNRDVDIQICYMPNNERQILEPRRNVEAYTAGSYQDGKFGFCSLFAENGQIIGKNADRKDGRPEEGAVYGAIAAIYGANASNVDTLTLYTEDKAVYEALNGGEAATPQLKNLQNYAKKIGESIPILVRSSEEGNQGFVRLSNMFAKANAYELEKKPNKNHEQER